MSETKPQSDTDAVLSSVRRLITHGSDAVDEDTREDDRPGAEKLLLTPSLRIDKPKKASRTPTFIRSPREPSALEARIAELERAVSSQPGDWEPDGSEAEDEETPSSFVFRHEPKRAGDAAATESIAMGPLRPQVVGLDENEPPGIVAPEIEANDNAPVTDAGEIDEAALREIVAQMVRTELQGELGERITRNVRKLVRREIHRALITRDIE